MSAAPSELSATALESSSSQTTTAGTAEDRAAIQRYLAEHRVTELLYQVLESICVEKPANPHQYIVDYLSKNHAGLVTVAASDAAAAATAEADDDYVNELLQEDEDDDDDVGELPQQPPTMMPPVAGNASRRRSAVSAESMNAAALQMQYKKMVYEKTAANRATLNDILKENFLFKGLDGDQMTTLLDAMFMANFEAGKAIIEQGAEGDNFYVVFEGECEVFVSKGGDEKMVLACGKGDSFGELALMYNAPRAATVRAKTDCVLFAVDRITFKFILMDTTTKKRNLYDSFLKNVPILATLTEYERSTISDALTEATFGDGETIISQGEAGDAFYIVYCGTFEAHAEKTDGPVQPARRGDGQRDDERRGALPRGGRCPSGVREGVGQVGAADHRSRSRGTLEAHRSWRQGLWARWWRQGL